MDNNNKKNKGQKRDNWPVTAFFLTFGLALLFSLISETTIAGIPIVFAVLVLVLIVLVGVIADIIGVAVTYETSTAFTSMASKKIRGAREAINLVQNADRVSNICNDVIGDICGIVSGAMCIAIVEKLLTADMTEVQEIAISVLASALLSAMTVSGKAAGKRIAITHSNQIVFFVAKILSTFQKKKEK